MWFLLTQIFFLLLLAALLGAALAYWWMKNNFEDVTASHSQLLHEASQQSGRLTQDELKAEFAALSMPDLEPVEDRLKRIESSVALVTETVSGLQNTDLEPVETEVRVLANRIENLDIPDLEGVSSNLSSLFGIVEKNRGPDMGPVEIRLARIEGAIKSLPIPKIDLGPLHSGLAQLELAISGLEQPVTDLQPVSNHIRAVEARIGELEKHLDGTRKADIDTVRSSLANMASNIAAIQAPDLEPVQSRLLSVEQAIARITIPETDLSSVLTRLDGIKTDLASPNQDLGALQSRLAGLEATIGAMRGEVHNLPSLQPIEARLASLQDALLRIPQPDLSPVLHSVRTIESRMDLSAMENRLTAIEYGLAAMHHMLRTRLETTLAPPMTNGDHLPPIPTETVQMETRTPAAIPPRASDPINPARRDGDRANLLVEAAFGSGDDLEHISGVGPMLRQLLNDTGVYYFWQIAEWSPEDVDWVDEKLQHFRGRISRDNWVEQARNLAAHHSSARRPAAFIPGEPLS